MANRGQGGAVYLGIGSNQGDRLLNMRKAMLQVVGKSGSIVTNVSSVYETEPWGKEDQAWFYNAVLEIKTGQKPDELLQSCRKIEADMESDKKEHWGPRKIDLDILFYGQETVTAPDLTIPHPQVAARRFVLEPLAEIAPELEHPVLKKDMKTLLAQCPDAQRVRKLKEKL